MRRQASVVQATGLKTLLVLLGVYLLGASVSAQAQGRSLPVDEPEALTVSFDPPLGTPLSYSLVVRKERPRGYSSLAFEQELTFERHAEGYYLHLDVLALEVNGVRMDLSEERVKAALPPAIRPFVMSVKMVLDPAGEPVRMDDWETLRTQLSELPDLISDEVNIEPQDRERAQAVMDQILAPLLTSSAEDAPAMIVQGWPTVLGYGGMELDNGEAYEADTLIEGGLLPNPIDANVELSMSRNSRGDYQFTQTTTADPDALKAAISTLVDRFEAMSMQLSGPKSREDKDTDFEIAMTDDLDIVFDDLTGMPETAEIVRATLINGKAARRDIITIRRVTP